MSNRWYYLVGLVLFAGAVVELFAPNTLGLPVSNATAAVVGVVALLYAVSMLLSQRGRLVTFAATPDVELRRPTVVPGERIDDVVESFSDATAYGRSPAALRSGFERIAVAVLTRYGSYSEDEAEAAVEDGSWTDDQTVGKYLAGERSRPGRLRRRFDDVVDRPSWDSLTNRTVDALRDAAGISQNHDSLEDEDSQDWSTVESTTVDPEGYDPDSGLTLGRRRLTQHWTGVGLVAVVCLGVGILLRSPAILLGAGLGIGYVAYARLPAADGIDLAIERTVDDETPAPGDEVTVTVRVTNTGSGALTDLRLVDGVPPSLAVSEGSPRQGTVLRPGDSSTVQYTVTATRGHHEFAPLLALVRNLPGSVEQDVYLTDETAIDCTPAAGSARESAPLRSAVTGFPGQIETETGGAGLTFQTIREYQAGDPLSRVDWNHRARTGELATVDFRQQRAASVLLLIDARQSAYVGPTPDAPHAVDRSVGGAGRLFERLLDDGNEVGIAAMGDPDCWLAPSTGTEHRERGRRLFGTAGALSPVAPESRRMPADWLSPLRQRLSPGTQLLVFSPLVEAHTVRLLRRLDARGFPVTVISPDPTGTATAAQKLAGLRRTMRLTDLREAGIPVVDWQPDRLLDAQLRATP